VDAARIRAVVRRPERALAALVAEGLLERETIERGPRASARRLQHARRLVSDPDEVEVRLRALRERPGATVLAWLGRPDVVLPTPEAVRSATGASKAVLARLESSQLLTITPSTSFLTATVDSAKASSLAEGELARAPGQARLLAHLAAGGVGVPIACNEALTAASSSKAALQRLIDRGLVHQHESPGEVALRVRGARLRAAERAERGVAAHAEALDYLAAVGGAAPVAEVKRHTAATKRHLEDLAGAGLIALGDQRIWRDPLAGRSGETGPPPPLTQDQAQAWTSIEPLLGRAVHVAAGSPGAPPPMSFATRAPVCLVHGVTGSGKTELYLRAIEHVLFQGRQAIVLVPEIALTPQTVARFAGRFPGRVGLWHSALSEGERLDTWQRARDGLLDVIVGSRSALFAPLRRLGLIVLDEEHADAYKQDRTPRYHARDVAVRRATLEGAVVLLGSATPAVPSMFRALRGDWHLASLPRRVVTRSVPRPVERPDPGSSASGVPGPGASPGPVPGPVPTAPDAAFVRSAPPEVAELTTTLPPVRIVDMRAELRLGNTSMFSGLLHTKLRRVLDAGDQAILFLNRRGSATFVLCRDCGHVMRCPHCAVPLTWHHPPRAGRHAGTLRCHHCDHVEPPPMLCPECGGNRIRYFGVGTEKVEQVTQEAFPDARLLRWDADTTATRGAHEAILARFAGGEADVLIGTQMITKGLDLPLVTLVGVISADTALHFPDFRSAERAFQLLSQVAGRAGRSDRGGEVVFQTYTPDNPTITAAARHDYTSFYKRELAFRHQNAYPPFRHLVRLEHRAERDDKARTAAVDLAKHLRGEIARLGLDQTDIIGPAPPFFHRVRGRFRWQLVLRSRDPHALLDQVSLPPGWRVDVDPVDLL
jgi:primosomal protein N' (replication factor Y)